MPLVQRLIKSEFGWIFDKPVDPAELGTGG
jgi:hypothetical protein